MVAQLLEDTLRRPDAAGCVLLAQVTYPVPIGPGLLPLFWFSVPVSLPKKMKTYLFTPISKQHQ